MTPVPEQTVPTSAVSPNVRSGPAAGADGPSRGALPLIGRDTERESIARLVGEVPSRGGFLVVSGEPGIGKTRLLEEGRQEAKARGFLVLGAECLERELGVPYSPWSQVLREFVRSHPRDQAFEGLAPHMSAASELLPELADLVWLFDPAPPVVFRGREEFLASLLRLFRGLSPSGPVLLVLDDIGWADAASLELLGAITSTGPIPGLGLLAAYREAHREENPALRELLLALSARRSATFLPLARLGADPIDRLITAGLEGKPVDRELSRLVFEKSAGNPFFALELMRGLADEGRLVPRDGRWSRPEGGNLGVPDSLASAITQRLTRLDPTARQILRIASALGVEFSYPLLRDVVEDPEPALLGAIETGSRAGLLRPLATAAQRAAYGFTHPLIQEVLTRETSAARMESVHRRAAQALEKAAEGGTAEPAAAIAYHYLRANDGPNAAAWSVRAGDESVGLFARAESVGHYRNALAQMTVESAGATYPTVQASMGAQLQALGDLPRARRTFLEAAVSWKRLGRSEEAGDCLRRAAGASESYEERERLLEAAGKELDTAAPGRAQVEFYLGRGRLSADRGRLVQALPDARKGLALAQRLDMPALEVVGLDLLGDLLSFEDRAEFGRLVARERELVDAHQLVELEPLVLTNECIKHYHTDGDVNRAMALYASVPDATRPVALREEEQFQRDVGLPWGLVRTGDLRRGWELGEEGLGFRAALGRPLYPETVMVHAMIATLLGPPERAEQWIQTGFRALKAFPKWDVEAIIWQTLGRLRLLQGRPGEAVEALLQARRIYREAGPTAGQALFCCEALGLLVRASVLAGDPDGAKSYAGELGALVSKFDPAPAVATYQRAQVHAGLAGPPSGDPIRILRQAASVWEQFGWRYEFACTLRDLGEAESSRGKLKEAGRDLRRALDLFRQMEAGMDVVATERSIAGIPKSPEPAGRKPRSAPKARRRPPARSARTVKPRRSRPRPHPRTRGSAARRTPRRRR